MSEITFKSDTKNRKQWFTGLSFSHPAKMSLPLQLWIIENYTKPGDIILDPMAGSGTLMVCCSLGRHCILIELEQKFCDMMANNWEKVKQRGAQLGYTLGTCQIIQGDARNLENILCDKIITSPPYEGMESRDRSKESWWDEEREKKMSGGSAKIARGYSKSEDNIGNLKSDSYLSAMLQVYQSCFTVLKPRGLMILVTKNFIRNKKEVRLDSDTISLCETAGFIFKERHYRKLTSQSFWRTIYRQKFPDAPVLDKEDILVFEKM